MRLVDDVLVGVVLLASVIYVLFALGPRTLRGRAMASASALLRRLPPHLHLRALAARLQSAASIKVKGACGGCDDCGAGPPPPAPSSASEYRVPLAKVGRRAG